MREPRIELGDVIAARSQVSSDGALIRVRFRAGTDVDVKAARLSSELVAVRAKLPEGSSLSVWPSTQARTPVMVIALTGANPGRIVMEPRARATRSVSAFPPTSTMLASPAELT